MGLILSIIVSIWSTWMLTANYFWRKEKDDEQERKRDSKRA